ncbi:hypothetical protein CVV72_10385 [Amycolatopsis sp. TNS106]|nr:hypothetical protein CVV72_10385 [Amycolatopsis sp. TNS106]
MMASRTPKTTNVVDADATDPDSSRQGARSTARTRFASLRGARGRRIPRSHGGPVLVTALILFYRGITLVADFLLACITATVVIPTLAAWLHQQSGAPRGSLTMTGAIALWIMPLFFLVVILAAGEIAAMRALWHWGTRKIHKVRVGRAAALRSIAGPPSASRAHHTTATVANRRSK